MEQTTTSPLSVQDVQNFERLQKLFRAINHPLRKRIIDYLHSHHEERVTVTDLFIKLRLEQSVASQHLAILRKAGFVKTEKVQKFVYYSPDYNEIQRIVDFTKSICA